jgi:hypothetical protein
MSGGILTASGWLGARQGDSTRPGPIETQRCTPDRADDGSDRRRTHR